MFESIVYYGRDGEPILRDTWMILFEDKDYQRVEQTEVNGYFVSTVWLGLDHRFIGVGPPVIFETMVFLGDKDSNSLSDNTEQFMDRYCTEEEARNGHANVVNAVRVMTTVTVGEHDDANPA